MPTSKNIKQNKNKKAINKKGYSRINSQIIMVI